MPEGRRAPGKCILWSLMRKPAGYASPYDGSATIYKVITQRAEPMARFVHA